MHDSYSVSRSAGYGELSSASGYGYMRYVDCNSALALIGFILFVDILRDIIESMIEQSEEGGARKKRWTKDAGGVWKINHTEEEEEEADILSFIQENGILHLYHKLPDILRPALEGWREMSNTTEYPDHCFQHNVCQTNYVLSRDYGVAGRIVATLFSNVVSHAFFGEESNRIGTTFDAARAGRRKEDCEQAFPKCPNYPHSNIA
ncbi:hypothetical protein SK128_019127 [Halocaridina rubra]|uniref:Uncharacterized protein n=1 Tax=Halocaridina rubra TaxID=373956 RepID=A0AAN8WLJ8_HALRR